MSEADKTPAANASAAQPEGKKEKMVRIKAVRHISLQSPTNPNGLTLVPGAEAEVPESLANALCKVRKGPFAFGGELGKDAAEATRHKLVQAVRVQKMVAQ